MKECRIRLEKVTDYFEVEKLVRRSFWNVYRPGCVEHYLLHELRKNIDFIKELDFVMESNGKIIGQNVFVKAKIACDDGKTKDVLTMGPICIDNDMKRQGYGKVLLDYTLEEAHKLGYKAVLIEGDISFYGKSGFQFASDYHIRYHGLPEGADSSFFLCKELEEGYLSNISGVYSTPQCYIIDEEKLLEFDQNFS